MTKLTTRIGGKKSKKLATCTVFVFIFVLLSLIVNIQEFNSLKKKTKQGGELESSIISMPGKNLGAATSTRRRPVWWDSSKSTVIALAVGYGMHVYQQFIQSLRATGFQGHIILGVAPNLGSGFTRYFKRWNVTWKEVPTTGSLYCTHYPDVKKCTKAYPEYKLSWGRFPLARDWLLECDDCTGGVMLTDARDAYFQTDPFRYPFGDKPMELLPGELMVFQETPEQTTDHWLTAIPIEQCRKEKLETNPMLCSGSTMGTRKGILDYINVMVKEFDYWIERKECRTKMDGDDQAIHNYLYYQQQFANVASVPHRTGPIHVVGVQANEIFRAAIQKAVDEDFGADLSSAEDFVNLKGYMHWDDKNTTITTTRSRYGRRSKDWRTWLPPQHELIDPETGFIINLDGKPSPQVHQFDRFGLMVQMPFVLDLHDKKK